MSFICCCRPAVWPHAPRTGSRRRRVLHGHQAIRIASTVALRARTAHRPAAATQRRTALRSWRNPLRRAPLTAGRGPLAFPVRRQPDRPRTAAPSRGTARQPRQRGAALRGDHRVPEACRAVPPAGPAHVVHGERLRRKLRPEARGHLRAAHAMSASMDAGTSQNGPAPGCWPRRTRPPANHRAQDEPAAQQVQIAQGFWRGIYAPPRRGGA